MDPKLLEILKKAKAVDERAKKFDSTDPKVLESNVNSRKVSTPSMNESFVGMESVQQMPVSKPMTKVDVNSETYKQRVKESKLPPEIQRVMLENPIQQPDPVGQRGSARQARSAYCRRWQHGPLYRPSSALRSLPSRSRAQPGPGSADWQ